MRGYIDWYTSQMEGGSGDAASTIIFIMACCFMMAGFSKSKQWGWASIAVVTAAWIGCNVSHSIDRFISTAVPVVFLLGMIVIGIEKVREMFTS